MSSTRDAGLRVLACLFASVLTLPRSAAAQKCVAPSVDAPGTSTVSGGSVPSEMALANFNHDAFPDVAVLHRASNDLGILWGNGTGLGLHTVLSFGFPISDVVAADFDHDGWDDVAVSATPDDQVYFRFSNRSGGFGATVSFRVGKLPTALTFGDYDDDGHLDVAAFNSADATVSILRGDGSGSFTVLPPFPMPGASQMATADLNRDGNLDIVAVDPTNDAVHVAYLNNAGGLMAFSSFPPNSARPEGLALGDFNEDGSLDLVTVSAATRELEFLRGNGGGGFVSGPTFGTGATTPTRVAAADMDGDGDLDAVIADQSQPFVHMLLGNGKGDFSGPTAFPTAGANVDTVLADFNLDGRNDVTLSISVADRVQTLLNDFGIACPNVSFERLARSFPVASPKPIAAADFDQDGNLDFTTANLSGPSYTRLLGLGNGDFASPESGSLGSLPTSNAAADFDFDGDIDVAVAFAANVAVQNNNSGSLGSASIVAVSNGVHLVAHDVSFDGKPDIVVARSISNVAVVLNDGSGGFLAPVFYAAGSAPRAVAVADLDNDGLKDLAVAEAGSQIFLFRNTGGGAFAGMGPTTLSASPTALRTADMNGDGNGDLVVTVGAGAGGRLQTLVGNGAFGFVLAADVAVGDTTASPQGLEVFDFNRDGRKDVAVALSPATRVRIFEGAGNGGYQLNPFTEVVPVAPGAVASGDFDRDGFADLLVSLPSNSQVFALMGNGAGRFSPNFYSGPTANADSRAVAHGDFNGDGLLDLVVPNAETDSISAYLGKGDVNFEVGISTASLDKPVWAVVDDFNSDGKLDVVVSGEGGRELGFHVGLGNGFFGAPATTSLSGVPYIARSADFDFDGHPDIVVIVANQVQFLRGSGGGGFTHVSNHPLGGTGSGLVVGDFDRDGLMDFAGAQTNDHSIVRFLGTSPGTFGLGSGITTVQRPLDFDAGDINQDGFLDFAVPLEGSDEVRILFGNGAGGFVLGPLGSVPKTPKVVRMLDYNLDGFLDFVVASESDHVLSFYSGNGTGGFSKDDTRPASVRRPTWMTVADFDTDGRTDVAVVPNSAVDGDPPGVSVVRNTNCRARQLALENDVSTCDLPGQPFSSQPALGVRDDGENVIQCENRSVLASIFPGTGSGGASAINTTSITPGSGLVSYFDLGVDQGGAGFQMQFTHPEARRKLSRSFSQGLAPTILGPNAVCHGDPASYTSEPNYDYYDWRLDSFPVSMAPSVDLTPLLAPGQRSLTLDIFKDTCVGSTSLLIDVTETLAGVTIDPPGPLSVCDGCTGPLATSSFTGGGVVTYQWGYRTVPVTGGITPLAGETSSTYTIEGADFGVGTFYLVLTVTPACGTARESNEVQIDVSATTGLEPPDAFTALSTNGQVRLEFSTPTAGICDGVRILRNDAAFPTNPNDTTTNFWIAGADFACPATHETFYIDGFVTNGEDYFYSAWVRDASNSFSPVKNVKAVPFDNTVGKVKWAYSTGATAMAQAGLRVQAGITSVYIMSNDNLAHGLAGGPFGGQWLDNSKPYPLGLPSQARPPVVPFPVSTASNGALFVTSQDGNVYAIDADSLASLWTSPVGDMVTGAASGMFAGFAGTKNLIFAGSRNASPPNALRAFDVETGAEEWFFDGGANPVGLILGGASVNYAGERVYFGSRPQGGSPTLWALDVSVDGAASLDWGVNVGGVNGSPVFLGGASPRVVVGTNASVIHLRDASDGSSLWPTPHNAGNGPVKGFVFPHLHGVSVNFMFATTNKIVSIHHNGDNVNPTLNWELTSIPFPSTPIFLPGTTTALVGSGNGNLYQLNGVDTGSPSAVPLQLGDGTSAVGVPAFDVIHHVIYVGTDEGVIYAIEYPFP